MKMLRSVGAILAGMFGGAFLSIFTDLMLQKTGIFPPFSGVAFVWYLLLIALIYRGIYYIISGYIAASLAPDRPMGHASVLAAIALVITIAGSIANWGRAAGSEWYPIALILISYPCVWFGGKLRSK
jgi:hypothetical protein